MTYFRGGHFQKYDIMTVGWDEYSNLKPVKHLFWSWIYRNKAISGYKKNLVVQIKLDGVGPVDNRPSTDKLHHFVQKFEN